MTEGVHVVLVNADKGDEIFEGAEKDEALHLPAMPNNGDILMVRHGNFVTVYLTVQNTMTAEPALNKKGQWYPVITTLVRKLETNRIEGV